MSSTIATYSGGTFDFSAPAADDVELVDIAHGLGHTARFGGQARRFYSVAEHSVLVHDLLANDGEDDINVLRGALLHDAHEAYLGDIPTPLKPLLGSGFRVLAQCADVAIAKRFEIPPASLHHFTIKAADREAMLHEAAVLVPAEKWDWARLADRGLPAEVRWTGGLWPVAARTLFLERAKGLGL